MNKKNIVLLLTIIVISLIFLLCTKPIPQNPDYHRFADNRTIFGITNSINVLTNIPFVMVGIMGCLRLIQEFSSHRQNIAPYILFFIGVFLTGIGSGYYHLSPDNHTLVWDRLAMTIAFMSFFSGFIHDYVNEKFGYYLLVPLICTGIFSVWYWHKTEQMGAGDLRLYIIVQFLPILIIPIIMQLYDSAYRQNKFIYLILLFYISAKIFEYFDSKVFEILNIISGHSIKHLLASVGAYIVLKMLIIRKNLNSNLS